MRFPPGNAVLAILLTALVAGALVFGVRQRMAAEPPPDLEFVMFALNHYEDYSAAIAEFERRHGVRVQMHLVNNQALQSRLQSALMSGTRMPDLVEIEASMFGALTQGPLEGIGFHDLTDRIVGDGLMDDFVDSRLAMWTRDGRIFGIPHDIHPVMLAYRADILDEIGVDPAELDTWERFEAVAREHMVADLTGNGVTDRYAIDFSLSGLPELIDVLLPQAGVDVIDALGRPAFNRETTVELFAWYLRQTQGPDRTSFPAGWGQNLAKALSDGLILFLIAPDWRTHQIQTDNPRLAGSLKLMPLPAWEDGGRRTSTWGGSSLVIPKTASNPDLAWEFAKFLYLEKEFLPDRFRNTNIIPPARSAWDEPFLDEVHPFWGQPIGRLYADLAEAVPAVHPSPYRDYARNRLSTAFTRTLRWVRANPGADARAFIREELAVAEADVWRRLERNVFLTPPQGEGAQR